MKFFYGIDSFYKDVTDIALLQKTGDIIDIRVPYNSLFGDTCLYRQKLLKILHPGLNSPILAKEDTPIIINLAPCRSDRVIVVYMDIYINLDRLTSKNMEVYIFDDIYQSLIYAYNLGRCRTDTHITWMLATEMDIFMDKIEGTSLVLSTFSHIDRVMFSTCWTSRSSHLSNIGEPLPNMDISYYLSWGKQACTYDILDKPRIAITHDQS